MADVKFNATLIQVGGSIGFTVRKEDLNGHNIGDKAIIELTWVKEDE